MYRVLVVDDEAGIRDALARWLSLRGFDVTKAEDGQDAVEKCAAERFDVITMDLEMPRLCGVDAITVIRRNSPEIPILVLTAFPHEAEEVLEAGAAKVLNKPLRLLDLEEEIRSVLPVCASDA